MTGDDAACVDARWRDRVAADMAATSALGRQADAATERFVEEWRSATGGCAACGDDGELEPG
jgi:hypothetical protein